MGKDCWVLANYVAETQKKGKLREGGGRGGGGCEIDKKGVMFAATGRKPAFARSYRSPTIRIYPTKWSRVGPRAPYRSGAKERQEKPRLMGRKRGEKKGDQPITAARPATAQLCALHLSSTALAGLLPRRLAARGGSV